MHHAVIMAGGSGTRLWPMSRAAQPKQLLNLFGGKSLLRHSYERVAAILPADQIYIITAERFLAMVAAELPELPVGNLVGEPVGRDTAAAVGLAAAILHSRDPDGVMGVFTADHLIEPLAGFVAVVRAAFQAATRHPRALLTIGVVPTRPETAFGYVRRGDSVGEGAFRVREFAEKPDAARARDYLAAGDYYWNSGNFVWRVEAILDELRRHAAATHEGVMRIAASWLSPEGKSVAAQVYPTLPRISIDYAVMERAAEVLMVPMDCTWMDVGSWAQLAEVLPADTDGNSVVTARNVNLDCRNLTVVSDDPRHLVAAIGVEDLVVVHTADATLVCRRDDAQALKALLERVQERFGGEYT